MKRKKISTTPPKKDKETPAKEENSFLVGLMKKHDISYDQALKMAIQMDAEKDIFNVSKILQSYSTLAMILFHKQQDGALKHSTQRKPSTKVFDKTQEWLELERGKGAGLSKLSDEENSTARS